MGDTLASVKIVTLPAAGTLAMGGAPVTANRAVAAADLGNLTFTPAANASGDPYTTFTFRVSDGTVESGDTYTMTVDVTPVNDAPTGADKTVRTPEDTPYTFSAADFVFTDIDVDDTLASVKIVTLPAAGTLTLSGAPGTADRAVAAADLGNLTFTPAANASGDPYTTFTFRVSDGTVESGDPYTMTIDVTPVNDAPTGADKTVGTPEDTPYTFSAADFVFTDIDVDDTLASVKIVTLAVAGTLAVDGAPVTADRAVAAADLGNLTFTPAANASGDPYTTFTFRVSDGTAESGDAYTMTIDVTPVNDAPTGADKTVGTPEDTPYTFSAADFVFTDIDVGDTLASVKIATLPADGSLTLSGAPVTTDRTLAAADLGNLTFTPAANASGDPYTTFTFRVSDGTVESGDAYTMTVDVTPVNDTPTGADKTVTTPEDTPYTFSAADFVFTDIDVDDTLASVKIVTLPAAGTPRRPSPACPPPAASRSSRSPACRPHRHR